MREKITDGRRQRQRQANLFMDAAEMAVSHRDYARALSLLDEVAKVDPSTKGIVELRAQAEEGCAAAEQAERRRKDLEVGLAEANRAVEARDFPAARAALARIAAIDPDNARARSLATRLQRAETAARADAQPSRSGPVAGAPARRGSAGLIVVAIVVIAIAAVVGYYFFR